MSRVLEVDTEPALNLPIQEIGEPEDQAAVQHAGDLSKQVIDVLVKQLGHNRSEAGKMVAEALERNPEAITPEALFEEVYRGTKK